MPMAILLVYGLCTPPERRVLDRPDSPPPGGPPYTPIAWGAGFSQNAMMNASPQLMLTGIRSAHGDPNRRFLCGGSVRHEYRNGTLLSTVTRDLRFDVVPCQVTLVRPSSSNRPSAPGSMVILWNQSVNSGSYWDFPLPPIRPACSLPAMFQDTARAYRHADCRAGWPCAISIRPSPLYTPLIRSCAIQGRCASDLPVEQDASDPSRLLPRRSTGTPGPAGSTDN